MDKNMEMWEGNYAKCVDYIIQQEVIMCINFGYYVKYIVGFFWGVGWAGVKPCCLPKKSFCSNMHNMKANPVTKASLWGKCV